MFVLSTARRLTMTGVLAFTVACTDNQTSYQGAQSGIDVPAKWSSFTASQPQMVDSQWLASFNDPALLALVNRALANNRDLQAASARLAESRALARQSGASLYPQLLATFEGRVDDQSGAASDEGFDYGLSVNWEADIWGSIRGTRRAAALDAVAQEALFEFARQSIAARVATQWIDIRANNALVQVARDERAARQNRVARTRERLEAGTILESDLDLAQSDLFEAEAELAAARRTLSTSRRAMDVLLGRYPDGQIAAPAWLHSLPPRPRAGVPSQLLERRPDVVAAERQVAAAFARRGAAQAARLPRLSLTGRVAASGGDFDQILDPDEIVWTLIGNLIAPLVDGGDRLEQVRIETARQEQALARYASTALVAFSEVENALARERSLLAELGAYENAIERVRAVREFETERFAVAEIGPARLSNVQEQFFDARRNAIRVHAALLRNRVALHLALGGSIRPVALASATGE